VQEVNAGLGGLFTIKKLLGVRYWFQTPGLQNRPRLRSTCVHVYPLEYRTAYGRGVHRSLVGALNEPSSQEPQEISTHSDLEAARRAVRRKSNILGAKGPPPRASLPQHAGQAPSCGPNGI
jgi:hypothetical protein